MYSKLFKGTCPKYYSQKKLKFIEILQFVCRFDVANEIGPAVVTDMVIDHVYTVWVHTASQANCCILVGALKEHQVGIFVPPRTG